MCWVEKGFLLLKKFEKDFPSSLRHHKEGKMKPGLTIHWYVCLCNKKGAGPLENKKLRTTAWGCSFLTRPIVMGRTEYFLWAGMAASTTYIDDSKLTHVYFRWIVTKFANQIWFVYVLMGLCWHLSSLKGLNVFEINVL